MKLLKELMEDEIVDLSEAIRQAPGLRNKIGGFVKNIGGWMSKHPVASAFAAQSALDAYSKYKKNRRFTTRLFAKTPEEKKLYKAIIEDLMRTGKYKKVREKFVDGGIMWELRRNSNF